MLGFNEGREPAPVGPDLLSRSRAFYHLAQPRTADWFLSQRRGSAHIKVPIDGIGQCVCEIQLFYSPDGGSGTGVEKGAVPRSHLNKDCSDP